MTARRTSLFATAALGAVVAVAFVVRLSVASEGSAKPAAGPVEVDVAEVVVRTVTDAQTYSGRLQAIDHVDIRAQVPGTIEEVFFKDGQTVAKGDPLFLIDPRPYQAQLNHAVAVVSETKARARFAALDFERAKRLIEGNALSRRDFDDKSNLTLAAAAAVKVAEADVEQARVNLGYTRINAPVAGRMSRAEFTVGNVVAAGTSSPPLTSLVSLSPIYAAFDMDEQAYLSYMGDRTATDIRVHLGLATDTGYPRAGTLYFVDNQLDAGAGTIRARAIFRNDDGLLVPGLFARVKVEGGKPHDAVLIDERAISTDQARKFVLLVDDKNHAQYREVVSGPDAQGLREIKGGLKRGDRIVVSGIQRVHPGDPVRPKMVPMQTPGTPGDALALQAGGAP